MHQNQLKPANVLKAKHITKQFIALPRAEGLYKLAFDNSLQANIITSVSDMKIIKANKAACRLLGYSSAELLSLGREDIFVTDDSNYKMMLKQRDAKGHSTGFLTAVKKNGTAFPCLITSAVFRDLNGAEKVITSMVNMSQSLLKQKNIDTEKGKIVADNIIQAQSKSDEEKLCYEQLSEEKIRYEIRLKEKQIAEAMEDAKDSARSDIGKELHDNINQLLGASRMYLEMATRGGMINKMYLSRSSEYILTAIEEIRKLTKGLATDTIIHLGLCEAIENIAEDTMEISMGGK